MKQVFKLYYDFNKTQLKIIEELSYHTTKLYNMDEVELVRLNGLTEYINQHISNITEGL